MSDNEKQEINEKEKKALPRKLVYKKRSPVNPQEEEKKRQNILTSEDLELFQELAPKLSPKGREIINLFLTVFDQKGNFNLSQLLQMISLYTGENKSTPSSSPASSLMELLPLISSLTGGGNQGQGGSPINPAALASLFSLLGTKTRD